MKTQYPTLIAIVCVMFVGLVAGQLIAQESRPNNLFSQYYTQPGVSSVNAEMYPAPHQVPRHVGHTYNTYQPLMPHEFMYEHQRDYYRYYATPETFYRSQCGGPYDPGGYGLNKTSVRWQSGSNSVAPLPGNILPIQRLNNIWSNRYAVPRPKTGSHWGGLGGIGCHGKGCLGRGGCLGKGCLGAHFGGGVSESFSDGVGGFGGGFDGGFGGGFDGGFGGCESCASNSNSDWTRARQQAVARTAQALNDRIAR